MAELIGQRFLASCWRAGTFRGHGEVILGPREGHSRLNPPFSHHMRLVGLVYTPRTACSNPDGLDIYALQRIAPLEFVIGMGIRFISISFACRPAVPPLLLGKCKFFNNVVRAKGLVTHSGTTISSEVSFSRACWASWGTPWAAEVVLGGCTGGGIQVCRGWPGVCIHLVTHFQE